MNSEKFKLKKGDEVIVLTGRNKGSTGKIDQIDKKSCKAFVGGLNMYKRHQKANMQNQEGGIVDKPMPIHVSNLGIVDPESKKAARVGYDMVKDEKVRVARPSGQKLS